MCASALFCLVVSLVQPPPLALQVFLSPLLQTSPRASAIHRVVQFRVSIGGFHLLQEEASLTTAEWDTDPVHSWLDPWVASTFHLLCPVLLWTWMGSSSMLGGPCFRSSRCTHRSREILIDLDLPLLHDSVLLTDLLAHIYKRSLQWVSVDSLPSWPSRRLEKGHWIKVICSRPLCTTTVLWTKTHWGVLQNDKKNLAQIYKGLMGSWFSLWKYIGPYIT